MNQIKIGGSTKPVFCCSTGATCYLSKIFFMGVIRQIAEYLYLRKRDPNAPNTQWMKYMHGINRISIFMFLGAVIFMLIRLIFFKRH